MNCYSFPPFIVSSSLPRRDSWGNTHSRRSLKTWTCQCLHNLSSKHNIRKASQLTRQKAIKECLVKVSIYKLCMFSKFMIYNTTQALSITLNRLWAFFRRKLPSMTLAKCCLRQHCIYCWFKLSFFPPLIFIPYYGISAELCRKFHITFLHLNFVETPTALLRPPFLVFPLVKRFNLGSPSSDKRRRRR